MSGKPNADVLMYNTIYKVKQYWNELRAKIGEPSEAAAAEEKWMIQIPFFQHLSRHNSMGVLLWNIVTNRFLFVIDERNLIQYDTSLYTSENGIDFSLSNFHPDYLYGVHLMTQQMHHAFTQYPNVPSDQLQASFDALYRLKDGNYVHILQQLVPVETDAQGNPYLFLGYIRDVTHLKKPHSSTFVFTSPTDKKILHYNFEAKELETITPFTAQEKRVLQLLTEGRQTAEIAQKLQTSPHTINTHRRHLLSKTNCIDTTALVAYVQLTALL